MVRARSDVDVDADVLIVEGRDRLLRRAAGGERREGGDRHRHLLPEPRLRGDAVGGPELRVGERSSVRVGLEQPIVERRQAGEQDIRLRQVAESLQRDGAGGIGRDRYRAVQTGRG